MKMDIKITLTEELLGTKSKNPMIFKEFIGDLAPEEAQRTEELTVAEANESERVQALADAKKREDAGTSVFHSQEGRVGIWDYQIKGFFKDACAAMNRMDKDEREGLEKLSAFKQKIDGCIFVQPRFIFIKAADGRYISSVPQDGAVNVGVCERPLRAESAQGPRVALARSETVPAGSTLDCTIRVMTKELVPYVQAWLNYGQFRGLGQWRNSGKGRFTWTEAAK